MPRDLPSVSVVFICLALAAPARAEVVVIVNADNPVQQLTREQVVDVFMGRDTHFPGGRKAEPIDLAADSPVRAAYYQKLVNKSVAQINAFWARLLFSGRASPPRVVPDAQAAIALVRQNREAIAYIDSQDLSDKVRVVYRLP